MACQDAGSGRAGSVVGPGEIAFIDPPAGDAALAPNLAAVDGRVALTWLEPVGTEDRQQHRLRFSLLHGETWSPPVTIVRGGDFFANWADLPAVVQMGDGSLLSHWLEKTAKDTYAYSIFLARSEDGGATWQRTRQLNADSTATEHGFVSWLPEGSGALGFWLDGREMVDGGSMTLRTAFVGDKIGRERLLDERTCECCSTDAAMTSEGAVVVFRDRSLDEVRDIAVVRHGANGWSEPAVVHSDGWRIEGCPVNGPAVAARGDLVVVVWYTGAAVPGDASGQSSGAVKLAVSSDAARSFSDLIVLDSDGPLGRVDVAFDDRGVAWVSWLRKRGGRAELELAEVSATGEVRSSRTIASTQGSRSSGFPRVLYLDGHLFVAWVDVAEQAPSRIRLGRIQLG